MTSPPGARSAAVAIYLSFLADRGLSAASIGQRAAAIAHRHRKAGHEAPATNPVVQDAPKGIRRTVGAAPRRKSAATADRIRLMLDACPHTMIGIRDRALLALGFAGALRRTELVALQVSDLEEVPDGYRVTIRRSKRDQEGQGHEIVVPRGLRIRPVAAVQAWLQAACISVPFIEAATCGRGASPAMPWRRSSSSTLWRPGWIRQSSAATACAPGSSPARPRPAPQS
jgi:integrase